MHPLNFHSCILFERDAQLLSEIESHYGLRLAALSSQDQLALRSVLSRYIYYKTFLDNYLLSDAITDTMPNLEASICEAMIVLEGISPINAELLIRFVTDQQIGCRD